MMGDGAYDKWWLRTWSQLVSGASTGELVMLNEKIHDAMRRSDLTREQAIKHLMHEFAGFSQTTKPT